MTEGIAVDARLVQSASRPISTVTLKEEREKRQTREGQVDRNGKPLKFSRDIESDWTAEKDSPLFGLKEHAAVDTRHGFLRATEITPASHHDSPYLPLCIAGSCHTGEPIQKVYADKGYFGEPNQAFLTMNGIADGIMRAKRSLKKSICMELLNPLAVQDIRFSPRSILDGSWINQFDIEALGIKVSNIFSFRVSALRNSHVVFFGAYIDSCSVKIDLFKLR
jgi:hypothetical protein